jgi:hypothetical protein
VDAKHAHVFAQHITTPVARVRVAIARKEGRELSTSLTQDFWAWDSYACYVAATALWAVVLAIVSVKLYKYDVS